MYDKYKLHSQIQKKYLHFIDLHVFGTCPSG